MIRMEVTRIMHTEGAGATKAFVDISIEDSFIIKGLRVVEGGKGLFVSMPTEDGKDGKWYNTVIPLRREVKEELERIILQAYGE